MCNYSNPCPLTLGSARASTCICTTTPWSRTTASRSTAELMSKRKTARAWSACCSTSCARRYRPAKGRPDSPAVLRVDRRRSLRRENTSSGGRSSRSARYSIAQRRLRPRRTRTRSRCARESPRCSCGFPWGRRGRAPRFRTCAGSSGHCRCPNCRKRARS